MKNLVIFPRRLRWLLGSFVSSFCLAGFAVAGPGGAGAAGGVGSAAAVGVAGGGASVGGGGHVGSGSSGGSSLGGGRSATLGGSGGRTAAGFSNAQFGGLVPTGFPSRAGTGVTYANGYSRPAALGSANSLRSTYNNGNAGVNNNAGFTMTRSFDGGVRTGELRVTRSASTGLATPQIRNAWTEPNNPRVNPAARASRYGYNTAYDEDRSALQNRVAAGQHIYPGAAGYSALNAGQGNVARRNAGLLSNQAVLGNQRTRDAYNRFYFTSLLYPYLYSNFFPFYGGYFGGGYGFGDYVGYDSNSLDDPAYNTPINGNVTNASINPYGNNGGDQNSPNESVPPTDDNTLPPNQPSSVGPQNPPVSQEHVSSDNGPDTLVESVQNELAKRGYYGGKVDSMYNDATRAALKRFQTDQQLAVTGRINEATLHALQLD